jgi:hypothetical protein
MTPEVVLKINDVEFNVFKCKHCGKTPTEADILKSVARRMGYPPCDICNQELRMVRADVRCSGDDLGALLYEECEPCLSIDIKDRRWEKLVYLKCHTACVKSLFPAKLQWPS